MQEIPKAYEAVQVEQRLYKFWMDGGFFKPKIDPAKKPFVIIMPPPNVTGELHVGHAMTAAIEDTLVRWHRMMGDPTLWLPGVDHAGIATQFVVEQKLLKEGIDRHQLGREKFVEYVLEWVNKTRHAISHQHQRLGASCDWDRECFTLDEGPQLAVRTTFVNLYNKGLIYKGERLVTWCPHCRTAISDLEVQHKDINGNLYYMRYPLADGEGFVTVATTRPETYLGDTAVAVNPKDKRYKNLVGRKVILPVVNRTIPIIADDAVDSSFGTGAVKITPAHDPVDFEMGERQHLAFITIMNPDATINENGGPYSGMERFAARKKIIEDFQKAGLFEKIEPHGHAVGHCDRCQTMTEPMVSKQWFLKMDTLAKPAIEAVRDGRITIIPDRFVKVYFNWMENIRDWCISRQLWWGHRIPVWYCNKCNKMIVAVETPSKCSHCDAVDIVQETDVLDTWFSSGLWPHSTLGWPKKTDELKYFYPTTVMETAYDILFFWVARMIFMGLENTGEIPFKYVFLHGLVRDEKGHKMSKVRGNVINPLSVIEKYGTDAMRFALTTGTSPGNDTNMGENKLEAGRNFANKIWNASRFVLQNVEKQPVTRETIENSTRQPSKFIEDRWIVSRLNRCIDNVTSYLNDFQLGEAQREIHEFFWGEYCDWYVEIAKSRLSNETESPLPVLIQVLENALRLLHPFMPFITEEIWQNMKQRIPGWNASIPALIVAPYPTADKGIFDPEAERVIEAVIEIVRSIRNIRAEYKVDIGKWIEARVYAGELAPAIKQHAASVESMAKARPLSILGREHRETTDDKAIVTVLKEAELVIPLAGMVDIAAESKRLQSELDIARREIERLTGRLNDNAFISKAPAAVVEKERERLKGHQDKLGRLEQELKQLGE